jgi:N-acetylneuraminic acid mutarotase
LQHYRLTYSDGFNWLNDVWRFDIDKYVWGECTTYGDVPSGRAGHSAVVWRDLVYIFGGWNGSETLNDVYTLNLRTNEWHKLKCTGEVPAKRDSHTANLIDNKMIIIGGGDGRKRLNDIYELNLGNALHIAGLGSGLILFIKVTHRWKKIVCRGECKAGRAGHVCVEFDRKLYVYGGGDGRYVVVSCGLLF